MIRCLIFKLFRTTKTLKYCIISSPQKHFFYNRQIVIVKMLLRIENDVSTQKISIKADLECIFLMNFRVAFSAFKLFY